VKLETPPSYISRKEVRWGPVTNTKTPKHDSSVPLRSGFVARGRNVWGKQLLLVVWQAQQGPNQRDRRTPTDGENGEARGKAARLCSVAGPEWIGPCRAVPRHRFTVVDAARPHSARRFGHANLKSAIQVSPGKQTRMPHAKRERHFAHSVCDDLPVHFCIHCGLSSASSAGSSHRRVLALCSLPSRWELSSPVDPGGWIRALFLPPLLKSQGS